MEHKEQEPINLLNLLFRFRNAFFQFWPLVLVLAVLGSGYSYFQAKSSFTPMYESRAIFTVDAGYTAEDIFSAGAYYDQYAAQQQAAAFPLILSTDMMNDLVVEQLSKGYINGSASAEAVAESNMLVLTVQSTDAQDAYEYLCAIIECYPQLAVFMMANPQVKIMTAPTLPTAPYNSFSGTNSAVKGGVTGIIVGLAIIFVFALLNRTIQTADELKATINLPILVALPMVTQKKRRSGTNTLITAESDPNMAESLRGLRVKVKKLLDTPEKKTILVTSTLAGEGKTTVAINLAQSLVRDGHKVLLLDADLRSQSVARSLGEKAVGAGLMECLKDPGLIPDCVRTAKGSNLAFISGKSTDKRYYTIEYKAMRRVLEVLTAQFDYVVIDTPPSELVSDATALCRYADCVMYVVKQDYVKKGQILNAITALHQKDVKIAGCVFNCVPQSTRHYGYGYRYGYGYGCGYSYGYHKYSYSSKYSYSKYSQDSSK